MGPRAIGDPSGRRERNLSVDTLRQNVAGMQMQRSGFSTFLHENAAILANNYDWMGRFGYLIARHRQAFSVNVMLTGLGQEPLERTDSGLSYTEFSHMPAGI